MPNIVKRLEPFLFPFVFLVGIAIAYTHVVLFQTNVSCYRGVMPSLHYKDVGAIKREGGSVSFETKDGDRINTADQCTFETVRRASYRGS